MKKSTMVNHLDPKDLGLDGFKFAAPRSFAYALLCHQVFIFEKKGLHKEASNFSSKRLLFSVIPRVRCKERIRG